jgi:DNA (cytosine-5)-methyltransferase 1
MQRAEYEFDIFAGGGGSSCGAKQATGRSPRFALNHSAAALDMHRKNHPRTRHILEDVWRRKPEEICGDDDMAGLGLFSPDCRHFSLARGGRPTSPRVRSLAWSVVWYCKRLHPRIFIVENVREFLSWGPMLQSKDERGRPLFILCPKQNLKGTQFLLAWKKLTKGKGGTREDFERLCKKYKDSAGAKLVHAMVPDPIKKGKTFKAWVRALKREGYRVEWRVLDAADHGVPTHRRRLFIMGRCDGAPIVWPDQTHASPKMIAERPLIFGGLKPYRMAAECLDFTLPTRSIFERKKDLAEKTQRRISKGFMRFVVDNPKPFIVRLGQTGGNGDYSQSTDDPLTTVTTKAEHCVSGVSLVEVHHGGEDARVRPVDAPLNSLTAKHGQGLAGVSLVELAHGEDGRRGDGVKDIEKPLGVVHSGGNNHAVTEADLAPVFLVQTGYGEAPGQEPRALDIETPLGTVVSTCKHAQVAIFLSRFFGKSTGSAVSDPSPAATRENHDAHVSVFLSQFFGGPRQPIGKTPDVPLPTVTAVDHHAVVAAHVVKFRGDSAGSDAADPLPTITSGQGAKRPAGAAHALGVAAVYIARFNHGEKQWNGVDEPLGVVTTQATSSLLCTPG